MKKEEIIKEFREKLWKDFITRVHLFCHSEDKTNTEDLEEIFNKILATQRAEIVREMMKKKISKKELYIRGLSKEAMMWVFKK